MDGFEGFARFPWRVMTEAQWLTCTDASLMADHLHYSQMSRQPSNRRKLRLLSVACCRDLWHLFEPFPIIAECVEFAEGYADGIGAKKRLKKLHDENRHEYERSDAKPGEDASVAHIASVARRTLLEDASKTLFGEWDWRNTLRGPDGHPGQARLFRDVFGNPFRPVAFNPDWRTSTIVSIARSMYDSRDFSTIQVLADALQDAGCANEGILDHCREDGPHVRGCWVVDLILGKE